MRNGWLSEEEKRRAKMCLANIKDKLLSIENELNKDMAYRSYLSEKIESVCWDSNCIKRMCEVEEECKEEEAYERNDI